MKLRRVATATALLALLALFVTACGGDDDDGADGGAPAASSRQSRWNDFAGTYEGTWTNEAAGTSGPASIQISIDDKARTASLTIDFGGNYLGLGDPPPATLTGSFNDRMAIAKGTSDLFGAYDVVIDSDGKIRGLMERLAGGAIPRMTYTGTITRDSLDADYEIVLGGGKTAQSVLRLKRK